MLNAPLQTDEGEDDLKKGTQLLEIYALEIQMYTAQKNNKKLKVSSIVVFYLVSLQEMTKTVIQCLLC